MDGKVNRSQGQEDIYLSERYHQAQDRLGKLAGMVVL